MARPRAFDPEQAVEEAMGAFWDHGFAATSVNDLLEQMNLNRGSLYDTFGDKKHLFLAALARYDELARERFWSLLDEPGPARVVIRKWMLVAGEHCGGESGRRGCLAAKAAMEVAPHDKDVAAWFSRVTRRNEKMVAAVIARGQGEGQINTRLVPLHAARLLLCCLTGMRLMGVAAPPRKEVEAVIDLAIRVLD